jgi:hypothetical protein
MPGRIEIFDRVWQGSRLSSLWVKLRAFGTTRSRRKDGLRFEGVCLADQDFVAVSCPILCLHKQKRKTQRGNCCIEDLRGIAIRFRQ